MTQLRHSFRSQADSGEPQLVARGGPPHLSGRQHVAAGGAGLTGGGPGHPQPAGDLTPAAETAVSGEGGSVSGSCRESMSLEPQ